MDFLWVEITSRCNLHCIYCYAGAGDKVETNEEVIDFETKKEGTIRHTELSVEELRKILDEAADIGCRKIQFTGGEPTLRDDLTELLEYAKARGFEYIEVFTNGTLLTEPLVRFLAERGIRVAMSIYSYRAETHDAITGVPGSFERTLNSLKLLLAYGVSVRCAIVAMKQNEDDLEGTSYFLSKLGVLDRAPDPIRPSGRGKGMENWPEKYGQRFIRSQPTFLVNRESYERNRRWNSCWFAKAAITSLGDVLPCVFARDLVVGNIRMQSLHNVIFGEKMLALWRLTKDLVEVCKDCEYRYLCEDCRPWAYGFTDNLYAKPPRCTYNPYSGEWAENLGAQVNAEGCVGFREKDKDTVI